MVLADLVQFLVSGFKAAYQLLSALAKPHAPQLARSNSSVQNGIEGINNNFRASGSASKSLICKVNSPTLVNDD